LSSTVMLLATRDKVINTRRNSLLLLIPSLATHNTSHNTSQLTPSASQVAGSAYVDGEL